MEHNMLFKLVVSNILLAVRHGGTVTYNVQLEIIAVLKRIHGL